MKTITVKGIGHASVKPDLIVLTLKLTTSDCEYASTMRIAAERIEALNKALESAGFEKGAAKTSDFRVHTNYRSVKDKKGNYTSIFDGYECEHTLKIEFDFDTKRLSEALGEISYCVSRPEVSVDFRVKDSSAVSAELLKSAAENARAKAEILCAASGTKIGNLVSIDYNWGEIDVYSSTDYRLERSCMITENMRSMPDIEIEPEEIKARDTATFVWEIA